MDAKAELSKRIEHARHDLDESLGQLEKMPAVDADRLSYAAHALNNYLMVVSTISHVLGREFVAVASPDAQNRLAALNEATGLMKAVVRQLIVPADDHVYKLIFLPVDLTFVATAICDEYEPIAAKKEIRIVREILDRPLKVWADRIAVGAVVDNLMSNAVKYSRPGSSIEVRNDQKEHDGIIAVMDHGPGIRADEASRLFTRGGRLSAQPTAGEASSGYGLAIAKDMMDALGGKLLWQNHATGATFSMALPLYDPARHTETR